MRSAKASAVLSCASLVRSSPLTANMPVTEELLLKKDAVRLILRSNLREGPGLGPEWAELVAPISSKEVRGTEGRFEQFAPVPTDSSGTSSKSSPARSLTILSTTCDPEPRTRVISEYARLSLFLCSGSFGGGSVASILMLDLEEASRSMR